MNSTLHAAALELTEAGMSVVPVKPDGSKAPAVTWADRQQRLAEAIELDTWFTGQAYDGLGVLTGTPSGNLEMFEVEGRATHLVPDLARLMADHGFGELWLRLCAGWLERSPSGGLHWHYRILDGPARGNTKIARRPNRQNPALVDVLIETRGEGGFTVTAPSGGRSHPTGAGWTVLAGGPRTTPTLTVEERDALYVVAGLLDQMPSVEAPDLGPTTTTSTHSSGEQLRPGDDYNARTSWDDILIPHGWTKVKRLAGGYAWTRPDKSPRDGISATTGTSTDGVDRLFVFTTSTIFEDQRPYSKFAAHALLEHGGDHSAAAKALRAAGYGSPTPEPILDLLPTQQPATATSSSPGTAGQNGPAATPSPSRHLQLVEGTAAIATPPAPATRTVGDSEDAHAHRLIRTYGDLIRFCPARKAWLIWSGARWVWQPPSGGKVREYAKQVARTLTDDVSLVQRRRALSSAGISGCLKQAETDERILVEVGDLDADPWILNTPAGVVDLRTGATRTPDPAMLVTKTTTVAPAADPDPLWQRFLDDTFGTDHEMRDYIQRLVGLTLVGQVREQLLAFLHGQGANGKSTLTKVLMRVLGVGETGYAVAAAAEMLMIRKHSEHPAEIAKLAGARMVVCSELDDSQRFNEARIKDLTGGDLMDARFLYGQPFTFTPTHTMWLYGNKRPQAHSGGMAFWRRVKLLELKHVVPVELRDPALDDKLHAAGGTVLAWAIEGAQNYIAQGLREPASVAAATAAYAADQDTVGRFVADECHRAETDVVRVSITSLRSAYEAWCREAGEEPCSAKRLGQELRERFGVGDIKSNGKRFYTHITVVEHPAEDPDADAGSGTESAEDQGWYR